MKIYVTTELCNGCRLCLKKCNYDAIQISESKAQINANCVFCNLCVESCPKKAIQLETEQKSIDNNQGDILVFVEKNHKGFLEDSSLEIISKMKTLNTDPAKKIVAVYLSEHITTEQKQIIAEAGANSILFIPLKNEQYTTEKYTEILQGTCSQKNPNMFLFSATEIGRDLAPRLATVLDTGLTADCTELSIDPNNGLLIQTRPAFSGDLMASIICPNHRPMMATIRPHSFKKINFSNLPIETEKLELELMSHLQETNQIKVMNKNKIKSLYPLLEEQKIIVSVGRGIGGKDQIQTVEEFVRSIGAGLGCSRPIVDLGWLPGELQVGMSGKSISPKLYIALGISGSVQHLVGIQSADYIIAVNRDENAPIFKVAHLGIVGDIKEVLPELKKKIIKDE